MNTFFFVLFAVVVAGMAFAFYRSNKNSHSRLDILRYGKRVPGEIVDLEFFGLFYRFPVVRFQTRAGQLLTLTASDKAQVTEFSKGQQVEVCYLPEATDQFIIVSGLDVLVNSETEVAKGKYRLKKGQERRDNRK
ncbi:DUF3592 domain-containing protein [Hymenobacter perfusus]|uniref:DUF3592 domain-containing protein n=1 Tax=Hymenobacter perfusus TaxID=1236770 RepID=A0A3R9NWF0_9BACT|nr:DUF3592 domain-containing protein [Hymenobacter perfusus]RSK43285.1 hypothetical protein EI293_10255 [Hymenobacter perfusus]